MYDRMVLERLDLSSDTFFTFFLDVDKAIIYYEVTTDPSTRVNNFIPFTPRRTMEYMY